jgi:hypothetical protein
LSELGEAATPGEWHWGWGEDASPVLERPDDKGRLEDSYGVVASFNRPIAVTHRCKQGYEDARFIATARNLWPAMVAVVEVAAYADETFGYHGSVSIALDALRVALEAQSEKGEG